MRKSFGDSTEALASSVFARFFREKPVPTFSPRAIAA
jgi:hypothetical protein